MGRIITACVSSIISLIFGLLFIYYDAARPDKPIGLVWLTIIMLSIMAGIFLPVPIALILNLHDWIRQKKGT
jgi:hypothetical protein